MLSRRHLLLGSGFTLAAAQTRARAGVTPDVTVLRAGKEGFNGAIPGPVIRAHRGDEVRVRFVNGLDALAALCWHGVRTANALKSDAPLLIAPGASAAYRFTVRDAGTFWYRAVPRACQEAGLYGVFIVKEPSPPPVDQDHVFVFDSRPESTGGAPRCTVNGVARLDISVRANERLRLRFINASTAQAMDARIMNHRVMVMALDGEPAEPFASRDGAVVLGPGNRADVFVDATLKPGSVAPVIFKTDGSAPPAMRLVYGEAPARSAPLGEPAPLPPNPLPKPMNFAHALRVTLPIEGNGATPNNLSQSGSPTSLTPQIGPALFTAERGRTIAMALDNRDGRPHVIYLDGHHFRLLDRLDDGWKPYWLDTIPVAPRQIMRIAFVTDNPGRWRIENRSLDGSADTETWFEVR